MGVGERVVIKRGIGLKVVGRREFARVRKRPLLLEGNAEQRRSTDPVAHDVQELRAADALLDVVRQVKVGIVELRGIGRALRRHEHGPSSERAARECRSEPDEMLPACHPFFPGPKNHRKRVRQRLERDPAEWIGMGRRRRGTIAGILSTAGAAEKSAASGTLSCSSARKECPVDRFDLKLPPKSRTASDSTARLATSRCWPQRERSRPLRIATVRLEGCSC